jgi:hypothetical protein
MSSNISDKTRYIRGSTSISFCFLWWLGGAMYTMHQPGNGFWDGIVWMYYVGRYIAMHFAVF